MNAATLVSAIPSFLLSVSLFGLVFKFGLPWESEIPSVKTHGADAVALLKTYRLAMRCVVASAFSLCLTNCGGPLYSNTEVAAPTISGNGRIVRTSAAGGLYQSTTVESPSGQTMVTDCMRIQRDWLDYLRANNASQPNQGAWNNWLQIYMMQRAITVPDRCTDYATYGTPMSGGGGAGGFGFGGGRTFKR